MQPHDDQPIEYAGAPLETARVAMVMVHGRNAAPRNILALRAAIDRPDVACIAPAAHGGTWYPYSFMAPREQNEPGLSSALERIASIVADLMARGFPSRRIVLLGFSQGACLSCEFVLRHPRAYGGLLALSGGVIGPKGTTWDDVTGSLDGTPIFLGCSDVDAHVPAERVIESEVQFRKMGARVTRKLYEGMGHLVNDDEIAEVRRVLDEARAAP